MVYLILFEPTDPKKTYQRFFKEVYKLGKWENPLKNVLIVCSDENASSIYFRLKKFIGEGDNLLVIQAGHDWFGFLSIDKLNWLQEILG